MKLIFLDIDGVLNWEATPDRIGGFVGLCPERIQRFNRITDAHPDAGIVITSTWRLLGRPGSTFEDFDGLKMLLAERGLQGSIIGRTPALDWSRGDEIRVYLKDWASTHDGKKPSYVILDDDAEGMKLTAAELADPTRRDLGLDEDLSPYWVQTWFSLEPGTANQGGLQDKHMHEAISVFERVHATP